MINITIPNDDYKINRNQYENLPEEPAIYRLFNKEDELIYIGKTYNLKQRIKEHVTGISHTSEHSHEIESIKAFEVHDPLYLDIYETYLINKQNPKYNSAKIFIDKKAVKNKPKTTIKKDVFINNQEQLFYVLDDYIFDCESRGLSPKTLKTYKNGVLLFLNFLYESFNITNTDEINTHHIRKYLRTKNETEKTNRYINVIIKNLRGFFNFCYENKYIKENPMENIKFAKEEKDIVEIFNDNEITSLIKAFDFSDFLNARNKTIIALLFDTGIRANELINIKPEHILEDRILIKGKGNKERYVMISESLQKYLTRFGRIRYLYLEGEKPIDDNYFLSNRYKKLTVEALERIFKDAKNKSEIRDCVRCSPHTARHYFATKMLKNTKDIYTVSKLLGHSNIAITERYLSTLSASRIIDSIYCKTPLESI